MDTTLNRRRLLQLIGMGAVGTASTGGASAGPPERVNIGTWTSAAAKEAQDVATEVHREVEFDYGRKVVSGRFSNEALEAIERRGDVKYTERDSRYQALGQALPWGVDRVDAEKVHDDGQTGGDNTDRQGGADVAILDTGIDADHPDLQPNVGEGVAFADCSDLDCDHDWSDDNGHGTHCAGIAAALDNAKGTVGVAPGVTVHAVKVLQSNGYGYYSDIARGLKWVADQGYDVASLSLGGPYYSGTLHDACRYAAENGVLVVAAAGNSGPCSDCVLYPAQFESVVAVSATDGGDDLAYFSSTGPDIELAAPGRAIYSTVPGGGYQRWSGTSMACPHVSGAAAQLMDNGYSNEEARSRLKDTAEDIGLSSTEQGAGLIDVDAAVTAEADGSLAVSTTAVTNVTETEATFEGRLDDLGGADSADVAFEYKAPGASNWSTVGGTTRTSRGPFTASTAGLEPGTEYTVRAVASTPDGGAATGSTISFTTAASTLVVSTTGASAVDETVATLTGSVDHLGGANSATVSFDYREADVGSWRGSATETVSSPGSFAIDVSGLTAGTTYEFRAAGHASDDDSATGSIDTLTTDTDVAVSTVGSADVEDTETTLSGSLDDLGDASTADVGFEYRESGASDWTSIVAETRSTPGEFAVTVTGLSPGLEYEFQAVADASDGDTATGIRDTFTTDTDVRVSTVGSSDVTPTAATLSGSLDDLGDAASVEVRFEYRESDASTWSSTTPTSLSATGTFSADVDGLSSETAYSFRAVAYASDGDTDAGRTETFETTPADTSVAVSTTGARGLETTSATLEGAIDDLGGAASAEVGFEYREADARSWTATATAAMDATGAFSRAVDGLSSGTTYEFRAVADASDGDVDTGAVRTFSTKTADTSVAVSTGGVTDLDTGSATLSGSLDDLGGARSATVGFEYREATTNSWTESTTEAMRREGEYSVPVSGLSSGTDYVFRAVARASDDDTDTGTTGRFTTASADEPVAVSTGTASSVAETAATVAGSLDDLGGARSASVGFEYREAGAASWQSTATEAVRSTGGFDRTITGLESGTAYDFRAVADASDGDTDTGSAASFTTASDQPLAVRTGQTGSVSEHSATLWGVLEDLGGAKGADVGFEYREAGTTSWQSTATETVSSRDEFDRSVSGLDSGTDYEFRAVADASDGDVATGSVRTFTTTAADTPLAVSTVGFTDLDDESVTLSGSLDDLGGATSAEVGFEYRESSTRSWEATATETVSSPGGFDRSITGLDVGTAYEFRAVVKASDGDVARGRTDEFTTEWELKLMVQTGRSTDVDESSATLWAALGNLGGADSAEVGFQFRQDGMNRWLDAPVAGSMDDTGRFSRQIVALTAGRTYEYRAVADASDGDEATGSVSTFTTAKPDG